jgi:hypothetical protein
MGRTREPPGTETVLTDETLPPKPREDSEVEAAFYGAAVAHVINRPDIIRARAQVSATVSAAAAAAVAAFVPGAGSGDHGWFLTTMIGVAILTWVVSLWLYIRAIAISGHQHPKVADELDRQDLPAGRDDGEKYLLRFVAYAALVRRAVSRGTAATRIAVVVTVLTVVAVEVDPHITSPEKALEVSLSGAGLAAIDRLCDSSVDSELSARAKPQDLRLDVVPLQLDANDCMPGGDVVLHVRRDWIMATRHAD